MAVVKANAYGHGLELIAPALLDEGCDSFAVTDSDEGTSLRRILGQGPEIILLSGIFDMEDAGLCRACDLTPVATEARHVSMLKSASFTGNLWLKVDTGMRRLGCEDTVRMIRNCHKHGIGVAGIMSHLACADTPDHPLNLRQIETFRRYLAALPEPLPASLLNSAGLVGMPEFGMDVVRPGIALYGAEPVSDCPLGLQPVMRLTGQVMQLRSVRKGEGVSYGASFIAPDDMQIAVVSLGYGDGLPRILSNRGFARSKTAILPIVGRICMDYCLLDTGKANLSTGDVVEFWGDAVPATDVAGLAQTIAYELFTGVGPRVRRQVVA